MKNLSVLMGIFILLGLTGCATTGSSNSWTPLPEPGIASAVKIIPPGLDVPPQIAVYSGAWEGMWGNGRNVTIIIEHIKLPEVIAIYSYGPLPQYNSEGGWSRVIGRVEGNSIVLQWSGRTVTLTMAGGNANVEYRRGGEVLRTTLRKKN